ncbi:DNA-(apurinic or apyrimidinic site) lyase /endonuclease III [Alkalithermobacter thermoalcaliphilus JW-YL-7 = DSM 7308]|uniref:Endonuclease III n=1 Tax=Alkalithermobacter thermoalcaliphilus JW-YL-7 = DSM 7308 TaxID=1121328 RepID=A0A150FNT2_CLOPD|nr:endonuclease III [[Clostridium] paradoxum JW-YL-7 = DSM 7308]SHK84293.1 DNA-(apurinic or apyrimidinic site) lyase /endonuclease III [[Clostridium] paradoxum JW-YL-7 = DSM 7308]
MDIDKILDILEKTYPDAKCELNYKTPFELLVATILSAQCTDERVNKVTKDLFEKYNTPEDIVNLGEENLQEIIKSCGLYKSKAKKIVQTCKILIEKYSGNVPNEIEKLVNLPGVGRKTANVVLSNAYNIDAIAVDTHVFRVSNRIGIIESKDPKDAEFKLMNIIPKQRWSKSHYLLIFHGRRTCKAKKPDCSNCSISNYCKYFKEKKGEV